MRKKSYSLRSFLERFIHTETASSAILAICTFAAIVLANSRLSQSYFNILEISILGLSVQHWINDGLMTIFFFVIGMEVKRELVAGELRTLKKATLPVVAAIGGMIAPAAFYIWFNFDSENLSGWAIPMATDIAFVLGVLALIGKRVPLSLKIFLLTLAIVDDIGAVVVIATAYTKEIKILGLVVGSIGILQIFLARIFTFRSYFLYLAFGIITWLGVFYSGVHSTMAGVIIGLLTPHSFSKNKNTSDIYSPLENLVQALHPWVGFLIMPLFALANAGINLQGLSISMFTESPISVGILLGLILGKPIGILLAVGISVLLGIGRLPNGLKWRHLIGAGVLAGIGFTMSIFIANLSFESDKLQTAKASVLVASLISGILGYALLSKTTKGC